MTPNVAVVLAGGVGKRFGAPEPKQFLMLGDKTVLEHAVATFDRNEHIAEIAVVVHPDYVDRVQEMMTRGSWHKVKHILCGDAERTDSTQAALRAYADREVNLLLHDAARPLVSDAIVDRVCKALEQHSAVAVAQPVTDTIVRADADLLQGTLVRSTLRSMQTPQAFRNEVLAQAFELAMQDPQFQATDDCGVVAKYLPNVTIHLVDGEEKNKKLTSPEDLPIFCQWLKEEGNKSTSSHAAPTSAEIEVSNSNAAPTSTNVETGEEHAALGNFKQNLAEHNQKHLRQMQLKLVDILREITTLCDRHNIPYWLDSGTLLGAVRHGGFIPWDDDIDICVPVEDLPRLVEACRELPKHLSLQCPETEPQMRMPVYKVRDNNSLIVEAGDDFALSYEKGLFVDIFPMTAWPSFGAKFSRKVARGYCRANAILHAQHYYSLRSTAELFYFGMKRALFATLWKVGGWFCRKDKYYSNTLDNSGNGNRHLRTTVFPLTEIEFEGERFKAPANVDQYLKDLFRDYMALPPEEHRTGHAIFFKTHLD